MISYAIGDIHGHLDKLQAAHDLIAEDRARHGTEDAPVIHVGDLVDRGPDSAGVVEFLRVAEQTDPRVIVLLGNHDRLLSWFLEPKRRDDPRLRVGLTYLSPSMGGMTTLASYGVDTSLAEPDLHQAARRAVPEAHRAFLVARPLTHRVGDCLFVHAGIRPGIPLAEQTEEDLVWIRDEFLTDTRDHGPLIVHGHTPVDQVEHHGNRVNLDSSVAYGGPLSTVVIEGRDIYLLTPSGRVPVPVLR